MEQFSSHPFHGNSEDSSRISSMKSTTRVGAAAWGILREPHASDDASFFSSSLPVLPHEKLNFADSENISLSIDDNFPKLGKINQGDEQINALKDFDADAIGKLLPDDEEELLAGLMDDLDVRGLPDNLDDPDEYDFFGSGGGLELDFDTQESSNFGLQKVGLSDGISNGISHYSLSNGTGTVAGEHPYGEHPSRTLFVRNINSNVEDSELRSLFEQYGDIRTLYAACKHRGFVMISYYDIRAARTAMRALQNKPLRRRKLDIHFSIPKDNPSEKDINQGTLVVFNLDASVSNDELRQIFGAYGEVKEIRETPHKRHHKFVEFYDVRAAETALRALNRSEIAGKRIKLEPSRPGGARRSLMQQLSQELEQDEIRAFGHQIGSPIGSSPPGNWAQFASPREQNPLHAFSKSPGGGSPIPISSNHLSGLASILSPHLSSPSDLAAIGKDQGRINTINQMLNGIGSPRGATYPHPHSFPEHLNTSPGPTFPLGESNLNSSSIKTLSGPQFLWGRPSPYPELANSSAWSKSSSAVGRSFASGGQAHGFPYANRSTSLLSSNQSHHVGSAPSGVPVERHIGFFPESPESSFMSSVAIARRNLNHSNGSGVPVERHIGFFPESPESSFMSSVAIARRNLNHSNGSYLLNMGPRPTMSAAIGLPGKMSENGSSNFGMMSLPRPAPVFYMNGSYPGLREAGLELLVDRSRVRRMEGSGNPMDSKKQYQLDLEKIINGEDTRTTLMIKNIPNKYTSKMLLAAIDEQHKGTYDFLYLPIDFKNKCNVGYAFINMISPSLIATFYESFNGKKWEKFNSEKVASLAYARIQGKIALVSHFQNSSLMNEDKRCRPILFHSEGQETVEQEPLFTGNLNIYIRQADGSYSGDLLASPKGDFDETADGS